MVKCERRPNYLAKFDMTPFGYAPSVAMNANIFY